jgi:zinc protease
VSARSIALLLAPALAPALALAVACAPPSRPLNVPGPTTAHGEGYTLTSAPPSLTAPVKVLARRTPSSKVVAFRVAFRAGSADDPAGKEGLTRLTAHAMAEGGTASLTHAQLVEALYPLAASIEAHVDRDETVFAAEVAAGALDAFTPLLLDVIQKPRFDSEDVERVRAQTTSSLTDDLRGANDEALGKEALDALIYAGHPYGHPTLGTEHGLAASSLEDVKSQRIKALCRDRMIVGVEGGFPEGFGDKLAAGLAGVPACAGPRAELPAPTKLHGVHVLLVDKPSADSTAISFGYAYDLTRASPDFPAVAFFTDYLGLHRQSSGRLFEELREKRGLNYGDYAYAEHFEQEGDDPIPRPNITRREGTFSVWLRPVKPVNAVFALHAAIRELDEALARPVSAAEIERYRAFLVRYTTLEELTPSRRLGDALDDLVYGLSRPYLERMHEDWRKLDEASLAAAVTRHVQAKDLAIAIVTKDAAALAAALVTGTPPKAPLYDAPKPKSVTDKDVEIIRYALPIAKENVQIVPVAAIFKD